MTAIALKKELHNAVENTSDTSFLKAVYAMFREYAANYDSDYELSPSEKKELDKQRKLHKAGKTKSYTVAEVRKMAVSRLKK